MSIILEAILAYLINLATNERSEAITASRDRKLKAVLEQEEALKKALDSARSLRDEVRVACIELAQNHHRLGVTQREEPVWRLLADDVFQDDLTEWLMAGAIQEGNAARERMLCAMERAISDAGGTREQIAFLKSDYFDALEKAIFSNPILAHWRHQLSLDYLREQVTGLRQHAEEAAGVFSQQKQEAALERYCEKALTGWDIIDLSNLPEGDIHMATQKLLLRQLYMPLRIEVERPRRGESDEAALARMEEEREARRHREAGHFSTDAPDRKKARVPIGERLASTRRIVVLGDPGGGKTTMLRWMATAYLLRHKDDDTFKQLPDTETLPEESWIPVLIRCRDLGEPDLCRSFTDFLSQHLNKSELLPEEAEVMRAVILDRIAKGQALLLVDGLDEITNPRVRMMFCQELERTATRYPEAPIVVTSRIVGYRDMPYRMGSGFEHGQIAQLDNGDKDLFARRWIEITEQHQSTDEKGKRAQELLDALHSNDRIERLTGNPMLLTTLALVKRKVGKLPNKRTKLYAEAVSVLLNWNPRLYKTIEEDEAIPQLEYLAYEMCRRGVQRLTDDEVLDLLDKLRVEYPNIRAIKRREPHALVAHLEERSSSLIKSGGIWQGNSRQEDPVWEFRHLTFQEYLAARALLDGRYPGRDKSKSLAEQVATLAGVIKKPNHGTEEEVHESWREALRLLVADCKDDDVDDVILAILTPGPDEDANHTRRPRAILAALCLADEPNVSEISGNRVLESFVTAVNAEDGKGRINTPLDSAALALGVSHWCEGLKDALMRSAIKDSTDQTASLWGTVEYGVTATESGEESWLLSRLQRLCSDSLMEKISAAMTIAAAASHGKRLFSTPIVTELLSMVRKGNSLVEPAVETLYWLTDENPYYQDSSRWFPNVYDCELLVSIFQESLPVQKNFRQRILAIILKCKDYEKISFLLSQIDHYDTDVRLHVIAALSMLGDKQAVAPLLAKLDDTDKFVRRAVIGALVQLDDKMAVTPLLATLDDPDKDVRLAVIKALGSLGDKQALAPLLAKLDDPAKDVRLAVIEGLGELGDKQAVAPLLSKLNDKDEIIGASAAGALHALGEPSHLAQFLVSMNGEARQTVVRVFARYRDNTDRLLLSRDSDALAPWLDPQSAITDAQVKEASSRLDLTPEQIRARYEQLAVDLKLKLSWKS
ncbi:MAG: HEAT repeat domain-containing protein [Planctomycetaceae bacterium]|nr:HEAT repeat domain-containing protein [Planctomycetaceae bacterium]